MVRVARVGILRGNGGQPAEYELIARRPLSWTASFVHLGQDGRLLRLPESIAFVAGGSRTTMPERLPRRDPDRISTDSAATALPKVCLLSVLLSSLSNRWT